MSSTDIQKNGGVNMGRNAKKLREAAGVKQEVIAMALNISQQAVSLREGMAVLDEETINAYCKELKIAPHFITNMKDDMALNNFFDNSQQNVAASQTMNFNPLDKVIEFSKDKDDLHKLVIQTEKEKFDLVNTVLKDNQAITERILQLLDQKLK